MSSLIPSPGDQLNTKIDNLLHLLTKLNNNYNNSVLVKTPPKVITTTTYTVSITDTTLIYNGNDNCTLTLLNAFAYPGRILNIKNVSTYSINTTSDNGVIGLNTLFTALPFFGSGIPPFISGNGKWCTLQSDGINWQIIASN